MYTWSQLCFHEVIYIYSCECDFNCGKYGAYFHVFSVHSNDQTPKGNGLLCSVQVGKDRRPFLLTCCHLLLKEEEEKRTEMTKEACIDAICRNLRCEEAWYEFSGRDFTEAKEVAAKLMEAKEVPAKLMEAKEVTVTRTAKEVLGDCKDPVIWLDKVSG